MMNAQTGTQVTGCIIQALATGRLDDFPARRQTLRRSSIMHATVRDFSLRTSSDSHLGLKTLQQLISCSQSQQAAISAFPPNKASSHDIIVNGLQFLMPEEYSNNDRGEGAKQLTR